MYNMVLTLPITFLAKPNQPSQMKGDVNDAQGALIKLAKDKVVKDLSLLKKELWRKHIRR